MPEEGKTQQGQQQGQVAQSGDGGFSLPEKWKGKSAEDVAKAYVELEKKMGDQATEWGEKSKVLDRLQQYGGPDNLLQWATYGYQQYQGAQSKGTQPQHTQQQAQTGQAADQNTLEAVLQGWEELQPRDQVTRLAKLLTGYADNLAKQYAQQYTGQNRQWQDTVQRSWDIYRKALGAWRKNPKIDPEALLQQMATVATGDVDQLLGIASNALTGQDDLQAKIDQAVASAKQAWEQEQQNKGFRAVTSGQRGSSIPGAPKSSAEENALILKALTGSK